MRTTLTNTSEALDVPSNYSRIVARELGLQERELTLLLRGTGLSADVLTPGNSRSITVTQQMRVLDNALHISRTPEFGLRLGKRLQPASHGPMGHLVLSSPDVLTALEGFANYLPLSFPFSSVAVRMDEQTVRCELELMITPNPELQRLLQECFALMIQSIIEAVLGRDLTEANIELEHARPDYHQAYIEYFHSAVKFSTSSSRFEIPMHLARTSNVSGHSDSYRRTLEICQSMVQNIPQVGISTVDQVRRILLSSPAGTLTASDVADILYITKRTLQRRLAQENTSYRDVTERLYSDLASRHLLDESMTVEAIASLLGYCDTAAFRKAFHRWYGQSPSSYRAGRA